MKEYQHPDYDEGSRMLRPFLNEGELLISNVDERDIVRMVKLGLPDGDHYAQQMLKSGKWISTRVIRNAAFDIFGNRLEGHVAVVGVPKPHTETVKPESKNLQIKFDLMRFFKG